MIRFLVDAQLPLGLARHLQSLGYDSQHVYDCSKPDVTDLFLWRYAIEQNRVIVSKDEDFINLSARHDNGPQVLWVRIGNCKTAQLLSWFDSAWPQVIAALERGDRLIELRQDFRPARRSL